ncbi:MAG: LPS export ABC transporter permease LptF, partial [bacterium]|nr:LPS export ABC transporter permease LptF [bacterium]
MRLDRYILAEILGPLALGFFVFTVILLLQAFFKSARLIISSGVAIEAVGKLLLLSLPWIVVMTIPMALLFSILIAIGRLSSDSELVALRACGVSLFSLYRPIVVLSLLLTGLSTYLMIQVLPVGNHALQKLQIEILAQSLTEEVQPRVPHTGWQNKVLYIFEAPPGESRWKGVFLGDAIPTQKSEIFVADWGWAQPGSDGEVMLSLENAYIHRVDFMDPAGQDVIAHREMDIKLATLPQMSPRSVKRGLRELSFSELRSRATDPAYPEVVHNMASVELHKKFSLPAACIVFGLLALPLGFNNSRGGRSAGFAISLGVFLIYYVLLSSGEDIARKGSVSAWLAVWFPNMALLVIGLFLLARRNRDKSLMLSQLDRWIQESLWLRVLRLRRRQEEKKVARRQVLVKRRQRARLVLRLPEFHLRFPNSLDRYVLLTFLRVLTLSFMTGIVIYLVFDLADNFNSFLDSEAPTSYVVDYYKFKTFGIVYQIAPIIVLVSTLISFGLLSRTNEIIACKALGMSLYRLAIPVVLAAGLVATLCGVLQSEVLAASNERAAELRAMIKGQQQARMHRADRRWLFGKGNYLYNYAFLDEDLKQLHRLQIFKFDDDYRLTDRLWAQRATYVEDGWWTLSNGWSRSWQGRQETGFVEFDEPMKYQLEEGPEYFRGGLRKPEEMDYRELQSYIQDLRSSGQDVPQLEVALHNKIAFPVISLVMALVALPFAFRMGRQGALYGIGLSLVLGVVLMIFLSTFSALGENNILPPLVAVWSPSAIFAIFSLYLFLG